MKTLIRLALALYPRWWRRRYEREMYALLEDSGAGLGAVFDLTRGALVARMEDSMKRVVRDVVFLAMLATLAALAASRLLLIPILGPNGAATPLVAIVAGVVFSAFLGGYAFGHYRATRARLAL